MSGIPYNMYEEPKENEFIDAVSSYSKNYLVEELLKRQCCLLATYDKELIFEMTDMYMFLNQYMKNDLITVGVKLKSLEGQKVKKIGGMHL